MTDIELFEKIEADCKIDPKESVEHPPVAISCGYAQMGADVY